MSDHFLISDTPHEYMSKTFSVYVNFPSAFAFVREIQNLYIASYRQFYRPFQSPSNDADFINAVMKDTLKHSKDIIPLGARIDFKYDKYYGLKSGHRILLYVQPSSISTTVLFEFLHDQAGARHNIYAYL